MTSIVTGCVAVVAEGMDRPRCHRNTLSLSEHQRLVIEFDREAADQDAETPPLSRHVGVEVRRRSAVEPCTG